MSKKYLIFSFILIVGLYSVRQSVFSVSTESSSSTSSTAQDTKSNPRFLRIIILLSIGATERSIFRNNNILAEDLADSLTQKAAPIIVSGATLSNFFLHLKQLPTEEAAFFKPLEILVEKYRALLEQEKAASSSGSAYKDDMAELETAFLDLQVATKKLNPLFIRPSFNAHEWEIYKHANADLYLLIPVVYKTTMIDAWNKTPASSMDTELRRLKVTAPEYILGLRTESKAIKKINSMAELEKELKSRWGGLFGQFRAMNVFAEINLDALKDFFVQDPSKSTSLGYWNIIMVGHGFFSRAKYREEIVEDPRAEIAGLTLPQFQDFLHFLDRKMNTSSLFISTCFLGGAHAAKIGRYIKAIEESRAVEKTIDSAHHTYMIIASGITDISVGTALNLKFLAENPNIGAYDFAKYFNGLESLLSPIITQIQGKSVQEQQLLFDTRIEADIPKLAAIIDNLTHNQEADEDLHTIGGIPSIRLSKWQDFKVIPSEDIVVVDKEAIAKEAQGLRVKDKKAIIFTVADIPIALTLETRARLFTPAFVVQSNPKVPCFFEKIILQDSVFNRSITLDNFLSSSIFQLQSVTTRVLCIKALDCQNYSESGILNSSDNESLAINNMWIEKVSKVSLMFEIQDIEGKVVFATNGTYYKGTCTNCAVPIVWHKIDQKEYANTIEQMKKNL